MTGTDLPSTPGPKPPLYLLAALLAEWALHAWWPIVHWLHGPWRWLGLVLILKGVLLAGSARWRYYKHKTSVIPFTKSDALVTDGPFAYTRNPMYTGMVLVLAGEAWLFGSLGPWLIVPTFAWLIHRLFVLKEEEGMRLQFGEAYDAYCARVRRWG